MPEAVTVQVVNVEVQMTVDDAAAITENAAWH